MGVRRPALRDAGRTAAVRRGGRGGAVRCHHRPQRVVPEEPEQGGEGRVQGIPHQEPAEASGLREPRGGGCAKPFVLPAHRLGED